jgi:glutamine cyclotransferase
MQRENQADVLNGIMFDPVDGRLFVTGKFWPFIFEIKMVSIPNP